MLGYDKAKHCKIKAKDLHDHTPAALRRTAGWGYKRNPCLIADIANSPVFS